MCCLMRLVSWLRQFSDDDRLRRRFFLGTVLQWRHAHADARFAVDRAAG